MSDPILHARGLTKRFDGTTAVDALDLAVHAGEVYALLGPNGAGKTTTINLFLGFLAPDAGAALVDGLDVQAEPLETKRRLAYLPEQVALYPSLSGAENLTYFAALAGIDLSDVDRTDFLNRAGLQFEAHDRRAGTYSKGMRQKVGIALALAKGAKALLLDEPTSGLDPSASAEFSGLVQRLASGGAAVLMATHDLFRVKDTATRVGVLVGGTLREELAPEALASTDLEALYLGHVRTGEAPIPA
ncbi:MAG: ABC transporter ATP-binding protein [Bacteroidota bacterium]